MKKLHKYIACVAIFVATAFMTVPTAACSGYGGTVATGKCGTIYVCAENLESWLKAVDGILSTCEAAAVIGPK